MKRTWYTNTVNDSSPDTTHQILAYGTLDEILTLKTNLGDDKIKKLFLSYPKKVYTQASLNFIKNFILAFTPMKR